MDVSAVTLVIAQWVHTLAAALWVGGGLLYVLVLRRAGPDAPVGRTAAEDFRGLADAAVIAMVITGVVLAFDRLTSQHTGAAYAIVLGVKVALTLWMFWLAGVMRRRRRAAAPPPAETGARPVRRLLDAGHQVVAIGVVVFLLSTVMQALFERAVQ